LFSESLGCKKSLGDSLKCIQHPEKGIPKLWLPAFKEGNMRQRRMPTPLDLEGNLWESIKEDLEGVKPSSEF
jgi:hypothetical protein